MGLYLGGSEKLKINLDNTTYYLNLYSLSPIANGALLLSFDNYILKDSGGLYLTAKEDK